MESWSSNGKQGERETMSRASIVLGAILLIGVRATLDADTVACSRLTSFSATGLLTHRPPSSPQPASFLLGLFFLPHRPHSLRRICFRVLLAPLAECFLHYLQVIAIQAGDRSSIKGEDPASSNRQRMPTFILPLLRRLQVA